MTYDYAVFMVLVVQGGHRWKSAANAASTRARSTPQRYLLPLGLYDLRAEYTMQLTTDRGDFLARNLPDTLQPIYSVGCRPYPDARSHSQMSLSLLGFSEDAFEDAWWGVLLKENQLLPQIPPDDYQACGVQSPTFFRESISGVTLTPDRTSSLSCAFLSHCCTTYRSLVDATVPLPFTHIAKTAFARELKFLIICSRL
ncbi:hypothetical protein NLI96_g12786 [Meripilus lineatus]|uniref:Uncharacterized protein n=1 Tax=Meripilus lineatus TaxID=2056292 RepID=A0AAD5Y7W2_9APHY|nr:hypothetical protein NLI96_g12786 [Physisporinus lineatus]